MATSSTNPFAAMLSHISREAPRKPNELPGLASRKNMIRVLFPILPFVLFFCCMPLIAFSDKEFKAQVTKMATIQGKVLEVKPAPTLPSQKFPLLDVKYEFKVPGGSTFYGSSAVLQSSRGIL